MVSLGSLVGYGIILLVHSVIAAVGTRFFRLRLKTQWGSFLYTVLLIPLVLVVTLLVLSGGLGIGSEFGDRGAVLFTFVVMPLLVGYSFEMFWMPAPDEIDLPEGQQS